MKPSTGLKRRRDELNAAIRRIHPAQLIKLSAVKLCDFFDGLSSEAEALFELEEWIKLNGDGWSKDDWPHAQRRELPRSGSTQFIWMENT